MRDLINIHQTSANTEKREKRRKTKCYSLTGVMVKNFFQDETLSHESRVINNIFLPMLFV